MTEAPSVKPPTSVSLGGRIVLATLGFCLLFTLAVVGLRTWSAWQNSVAVMSGELKLIAQVYERTLSKSIWEMDRESMQTHIASVVNVPSVGQVVVTLQSANRVPEVFRRTREGWQMSNLAPTLQTQLDYEVFPGTKETVGTFALYGDERVLWTRLRAEIANIVITQVAQSLLLAGLIMLLFSRLVTVHVRRIAQHLGQLTPSNLRQLLTLDRHPNRQDELSQLVTGVNQLQSNLSDYLERQQRDEKELVAHRDHLADLVRERTTELENTNTRLEDANALLDGLARTDPLTGLANRRHFDEVKQIEFRRALRTGQPLSLLVCDIDFFKRYNDRYGHAAGDQCLRAVAEAMQTSCARAGDLVARIGGEEFAILLPGIDAAHGAELASHLCKAVAALAIPHQDSEAAAHVTISVGLAQLDATQVERFDTLFDQADKALYQAKSQGRNQVVVHSPAAIALQSNTGTDHG
ncbi:GGDEF domain-containing protein [Rhodoferax sp. OV413]|uniref:GGDEF domain-containing protein n=1 Tax=Rhodoferax sp. OV413 TaxID=1855285 RepID=UPI001C54F319|nr:GGDEF domain-containing protein [Rhodoferax sp. OV413]